MKIVDRKTFLSLPAGTLFYKYEPCNMRNFAIKGETLDRWDDFYYVPLDPPWLAETQSSPDYHTSLMEMDESGVEYAVDFEVEDRDSLYDADQLFAVLDTQDVRGLIARLSKCLPAG